MPGGPVPEIPRPERDALCAQGVAFDANRLRRTRSSSHMRRPFRDAVPPAIRLQGFSPLAGMSRPFGTQMANRKAGNDVGSGQSKLRGLRGLRTIHRALFLPLFSGP